VADQLWLMKRIRQEEEEYTSFLFKRFIFHNYHTLVWVTKITLPVKLPGNLCWSRIFTARMLSRQPISGIKSLEDIAGDIKKLSRCSSVTVNKTDHCVYKNKENNVMLQMYK